jgi:GNAT superfamily N-acetyltransferase
MIIRSPCAEDVAAVQRLAAEAEAEGFRFLTRFLNDLANHRVSLADGREFFLAAVEQDHLVGVGGVTPDPYVDDPTTGRLRHLYVSPDVRRRGVGRALVRSLEARALPTYRRLRLRTDTTLAARFYAQLGYEWTSDTHATHEHRLSGLAEAGNT